MEKVEGSVYGKRTRRVKYEGDVPRRVVYSPYGGPSAEVLSSIGHRPSLDFYDSMETYEAREV